MAYFSTATAPERRYPTGKNRVWDFFRLSNETHPAKRRQSLQPRRKIRPTPTKTASGIPYWPSRDPIEEKGGVNVYAFVGNSPVDKFDLYGAIVVTYGYTNVSDAWPGLEKIPMVYGAGDTEADTDPSATVKCTCSKNCVSCEVASEASVRLNARVCSAASNGYKGLDYCKRVYAHEMRHVMSWGYKIKQNVVIPLATDGACIFSTPTECENRKKELETRYSNIINLVKKGTGGDDGRDHLGLDRYATKYSPKAGDPWIQPIGVTGWDKDIKSGSMAPGPVLKFGSCQ